MSLPFVFPGFAAATLPPRPLHLAIGIFDGVHLGHRAVIEAAVQSARRTGGYAAVLTFSPHPSALLRPERPTRLLLPAAAQARVLGRLGADAVITEPFTPELARLPAEQFLPWLRRLVPQLAAVYVGENWRFGAGRRGDVALLVDEGRRLGVGVFSAPRVNVDGEPVSSTRIRTLIEAGDVAAANTLLGYAYFAAGRVASGKKLGRTIGFPTVNLAWRPELLPRFGVYVVRVSGEKSQVPLPGVANYGLRPTVEQAAEPRLETHLLGACPFDAGDEIEVEWLRFLRPERKFADLAGLRAQISLDRNAAAADFSLR